MDILRVQDIRPQRLQAEARSICSLLSRDLLGERLRDFPAHESQLAIDLQLAVDLLHNHEGTALQVAELASSLGYSRHYFSRAFKQLTGQSPVEYRDEIRMRRAADLLRQTDSQVKVVAQACGYNDPNYFSKVFRRRFGKSPLAHRHAHPQP